jgi:hypothetical protein
MRRNHENARIDCSQGGHRRLSALISLSWAVTLGAASSGCSGEFTSEPLGSNHAAEEAPSNEAADNALIESHLQTQGYDTSHVQFQGDTVIVEDDMLMSRALLLDAAEAEAAGDVEKGYFLFGPLFAGKRINLSFAANVSNAWRTALNAARGEWNGKTPMFMRDPGNAATINVQVQAMIDPVTRRPDTQTVASGSVPPGLTIILNSNFRIATCGGSLEGIPANIKTYNALHEMGHVLGFAHPPPNPSNGSRSFIPGTAISSGSTVAYATVMAQGCGTLTTLSPDDVLSAGKKYPSCMLTCENNCTFNVDPAQIGLCQAACLSQCGG